MTDAFCKFVHDCNAIYHDVQILATEQPRGGVAIYLRDNLGELTGFTCATETAAIRCLSLLLQAGMKHTLESLRVSE